jgi:eukaryotic-like serine/threonine-protein kinase
VKSNSKLRTTTTVQAYSVTVDRSEKDPDLVETTPAPPSAATEGLPQVGELVGNVYRLKRLLGAGMFGKVYVAQREDVPEHQVALKILPRSHYAGRNVERELVMLATVGHPHVVQLKDHGMTNEYVWLTMPVYEGETLEARLARKPLNLHEAYEIFTAVARGLEALHAAGLRHQDIKPENIFLAVFGGRVHPVLLDLGSAAEREAQFVAGTALYASPEQLAMLRGDVDVSLTEKMDTYCLGATILVSLVGEAQYPGTEANSLEDLMKSLKVRATRPLLEGSLPDVEGEPRELIEDALRRWLAIDPAKRPTMKALATQLDVLLEPEREIERAKVRAQEKQRASLQRFRAAVVVLMLGAGAVALWFLTQREKLRLMSEVENAKAAGQETLGNLDACIASYVKAQGDSDKCKSEQRSEKKDYEERLATQNKLCRSGEQQECIAEMNKLRDQHRDAIKACKGDTEEVKGLYDKLSEGCSQDKQRLSTERDEQKTLAEQRQTDLKAVTDERDRLRTEASSCTIEREDLRKQLEAAKRIAASPAPLPTAGTNGNPVGSPPTSPPDPVPPPPTPPTPPTPTPHSGGSEGNRLN